MAKSICFFNPVSNLIDLTDTIVIQDDGTLLVVGEFQVNGTTSLNGASVTTVPSGDTDVTNKLYVDTADALAEKLANKGQADGYAPLDGSTLVPVANIPALPESQITNLTTDLAARELAANKGVADGYAPLDADLLVPVANIPALPESRITDLTTDLAARELVANKGVANGYAPLDADILVPVANIPDLAQSKITNLTTDLAAKVPDTRTVNGHALNADVTVTKGDVGLANCDNTSDADKPVSTAVQTALDGKQDKPVAVPASATATGTAGQWAFDAGFFYLCVAENTWVRAALITWP